MVFLEKWLKNHPKCLLHFLMHIDALMLCRKFEPIPSSNFRVMVNLKNGPISENFPVLYSPCFFPRNGSEITQNFYCIFRYILMPLCYVESLSRFQAQIF